jgi:hypothetical protein
VALLVSSDEASSVTVELSASGRYARRVVALAAATRRVGAGTGQLAAPGQVRIVARFTSRAKKRYRRLKRVPLTVQVVVTDRAGNRSGTQLHLSLKR